MNGAGSEGSGSAMPETISTPWPGGWGVRALEGLIALGLRQGRHTMGSALGKCLTCNIFPVMKMQDLGEAPQISTSSTLSRVFRIYERHRQTQIHIDTAGYMLALALLPCRKLACLPST